MPSQSFESEAVAAWCGEIEAVRERMHALVDGMSPDQLNFKPARRRWSVGQCVDHLSVSMGVYLDPMEPAVDRARAAGRRGAEPYGRGPRMGRLLLRALRKPGACYPAPPSFRPRRSELRPADVTERFERQLGRLEAAIRRSDGLALGRIHMPWPAFRLIKISLAQAFELQVIHLDRHLDQADRVTATPGFPDRSE